VKNRNITSSACPSASVSGVCSGVATFDAWGHEARSFVVQHNLFGTCVAADSFWTLGALPNPRNTAPPEVDHHRGWRLTERHGRAEDGELHITLSKMEKV